MDAYFLTIVDVTGLINATKKIPKMIDIILGTIITEKLDIPETFMAIISSVFFISLNGISVINIKFFTVNIHYILVYYWVLKRPEVLSYGFIFLSGIITDVVFGIPIGTNSLTLMAIAAVATYIRLVTVKVSLFSDWISFIIALLIANFIYFSALYYSDYSIDYFYLFKFPF